MTAFDIADTHTSKRARCALEAPTMISQDDARQDPSGHRMLYVLGFGIAGAILSNMLVFIYFAGGGRLTVTARAAVTRPEVPSLCRARRF